MGFSAGLYVIPKYKDTTYSDTIIVEKLLDYEGNSWAQEHFKCAEDYAKEYLEFYTDQPKERIDFYRDAQIIDEYNYKHIYKEYANWCSNGSEDVYTFLSELGENLYLNSCGVSRIYNKQDICDALLFFYNKINKYLPVECEVRNAFRYIDDEEAEVTNTLLMPCDGIEVRYIEDDSIKRFDTREEYECTIGLPKVYFDPFTYSGYEIGLEACVKLLAEVDFDNSFVVYNGGW